MSASDLDTPIDVAEDTVTFDTFEEDTYNDEIPTISTSGSDGDLALLESNQLKAIYEEGATDEDPDAIPKDDSYREDILTPLAQTPFQEDFAGEFTSMADEETTIPVISITTTDDSNEVILNRNPYQASPEPLTDLEDLDHGSDSVLFGRLEVAPHEEEGFTDAEIVEASDDEHDQGYIPKISVKLEDVVDYGGTYEELVRTSSPNSKHKRGKMEHSVSVSNSYQLGGLLNSFYEKDGVTDNEEFDMSDEEDNVEEDGNEILENEDILNKLLDEGTVDISDKLMKSPVPSPIATPEPGDKQNIRKGKVGKRMTNSRKKKSSFNLLSPRSLSPHLSDITDTEIVYSDSEEENVINQRSVSPQERRRRLRQLNEEGQFTNRQKLVKSNLAEKHIFPELEISRVQISEKVPVKEVVSESDTENSHSIPHNKIVHTSKNKALLMEVAGALVKDTFASTDIEHFEGSNESDDDEASQISDYPYNEVEVQCGSVRESQISKDALRLPKQDKLMLTDTEDIETEDESATTESKRNPSPKFVLKRESTEEDDFEVTDEEYLAAAKELRARAWKENNYEIRFIEVNGQSRPLAITPDLPKTSYSLIPPPQVYVYTTDTEDLEGDSDTDVPRGLLPIPLSEHDSGLTDIENFEGDDEIARPKSPEPSDDENSQALPEPSREMILMKEDPLGRPVSVVLPLGNVEPRGLTTPHVETAGGVSDVEDIVMDDDDDDDPSTMPVRELCPTPDIPDVDGGIIHSSEIMKVQKSKLKVLSDGLQEPLTDTEDIFLSASNKRKRTKSKLKLGVEQKPHYTRQDLTDTEEIMFSDVESKKNSTLNILRTDPDPGTDFDDVDFSGEDDTQGVHRSSAVTPDCLRELGEDSYTALTEGSGPFTEEARQSFLNLASIPTIKTISPSPDIHFAMNTDTEDMMTSADEDGFSRAETVTPYDAGLEFEDHSSFVYMKHTRKFDLDTPEEAMHVKGASDINEAHTDIEDLGGVSEDERPPLPEHLFVNDTVNQVCVCLNSESEHEDSICVCVSKEHGGLSLVWNSKTSKGAKHHRGIHTVHLTSRKLLAAPCSVVASREDWVPVKVPYKLDKYTNHFRMFQTRTYFRSKYHKYLLLEDNIDTTYLSFYLYIENKSILKTPFVVKSVFKLSISLAPLGYITKVVICKPNLYPTSISTLVVCILKTYSLNSEMYQTNVVFYPDNFQNPLNNKINSLPFIKEVTTKTKHKIQNRAWSGSDILEAKPETNKSTKQRSSSVSKLISRFECLSSSTSMFSNFESDIDIASKKQPTSQHNEESSVRPLDFENKTISSDEESIDLQLISLETKPKLIPKTNPNSTFKPIIPIIPLKDRSVSPRRLEPAPVRESPAFKALCKRAQGLEETLTLPFNTKSVESPEAFLLTSYKLIKRIDFFSRPSQNEFKTNSRLSRKIEVFETLSGSPRLQRKLDVKKNVETEISSQSDSFNQHSIESNSFPDKSCSLEVFPLAKEMSNSKTTTSSEDLFTNSHILVRRTSSCPVSHWTRKGKKLIARGFGGGNTFITLRHCLLNCPETLVTKLIMCPK